MVPLCGKSLDIHWLLAQGYRVSGVELSELAVGQLFDELQLQPEIRPDGALLRYHAGPLTVWQGDFFGLAADQLGQVDLVYDRAALIALPPALRSAYAQQLVRITGAAPQLLVVLEYPQAQMDGPPFSVGQVEIAQHYHTHFRCHPLDQRAEQIRGKVAGFERAYALQASTAADPR